MYFRLIFTGLVFYMGISVSCSHRIQLINAPFNKNRGYIHEEERSILGRTVKDLSFFPMNGFRFRLSELNGTKAIVIFMRDRNCPRAEKYGSAITNLERQYSKKGIRFIYIYTGDQSPKENAEIDLKKFGFKEPYVIDSKQTMVNALRARTAGDVFVLTPQRKLIYRGPLDGLAKSSQINSESKRYYVQDVLDSAIKGKKIKPQKIPTHDCIIRRPVIKNRVFWNDVAPIIQSKCTNCHNPSGSGLMDFMNYSDVAGRKAMFRYVIENDLMPPWFVDPNTGPWKNDLSLSPKEKAVILKWIDQGSLRGENPKPILWTENLIKKTGDYVITLPEKVVVPSEGFNEYKTFVINTDFKKDKWIKNVQFHLKPKVIHHIALYIMSPKFDSSKKNQRHKYMLEVFGGISDGSKTSIASNSQAKLPQGAQLVLEIHYEPIGRKIIDDTTQVHIHFFKTKPKYVYVNHLVSNKKINIPPHSSNYKTKTSYKIKKKRVLLYVRPHMHLRGKASSIFVIYPNGVRKRIFGIDPFTKNFDRRYMFSSPLTIPKGSVLECINWFDNSAGNIANPDPNKHVTYGIWTEKNEMNDCYFTYKTPSETNEKSVWIKSP